MPTPGPTLMILCDEAQSDYTLTCEGQEWFESFPTMDDAIQRATSIVQKVTWLTVHDELGLELIAAVLFPDGDPAFGFDL